MNNEKVKIRYHHLMCIPRYTGEGYSEEFCENFENVRQLLKDNKYELVDYCDNICIYCPSNIKGKCANEQRVNQYDNLVKNKMEKGETPLPKDICFDCCWYKICKNINIEI